MKRFLSLLLVLLSLLLLPGCTELLDVLLPEDARDFFGNLYLQDEETEDTDQDVGGDTDTDVYIEETESLGYYYDQLSEDSRTVYRAIYLDCHNTDGIAIVFRSPLVFHLTADMTDAEVDTMVCSKISGMVQPAMDAMLYDHPAIIFVVAVTVTSSPSLYFPVKDVTLPALVSFLASVILLHFAVYVTFSAGIANV